MHTDFATRADTFANEVYNSNKSMNCVDFTI